MKSNGLGTILGEVNFTTPFYVTILLLSFRSENGKIFQNYRQPEVFWVTP